MDPKCVKINLTSAACCPEQSQEGLRNLVAGAVDGSDRGYIEGYPRGKGPQQETTTCKVHCGQWVDHGYSHAKGNQFADAGRRLTGHGHVTLNSRLIEKPGQL